MGGFDKILRAFGMDDARDDYYEDIDSSAEERQREVEESWKEGSAVSTRTVTKAAATTERPKTNNVSSIRTVRKSSTTQSGMEVCVIKPTSFEECKEIIDTLLTGRPIILNFEGLNVDVAQRIIDVCSGASLAISGSLRKVSNYIFLLTPNSIDISGDIQSMLDAFGSGFSTN